MTPDIETLARRAVACKAWRWMPGMLAADPDRVGWRGRVVTPGNSTLVACRRVARDGDATSGEGVPCFDACPTTALPDLSDAATLGCLLALVREAWGGWPSFLRWLWIEPEGWEWWPNIGPAVHGAAALVAALEAAPAADEARRGR